MAIQPAGSPFECAARLRAMMPLLLADWRTARAAYDAWRRAVPAPESVFAATACLLALARLFDKPRFDARGRSERASLPHALRLLDDRPTLRVLIDQAGSWTPEMPELAEDNRAMAARAGLRALVRHRRRFGLATPVGDALAEIGTLRDRSLAHSMMDRQSGCGWQGEIDGAVSRWGRPVIDEAAILLQLISECCDGLPPDDIRAGA